MKTGMNLLLWTGHVTEEHFPLLEKLKKTGFDGVEIPVFEGEAAHYKMLGAQLKNLGLGCTTVTVVGPEHSPISPDATTRQGALDRHKWAIEMTAHLGGENMCGPFHSPLGIFTGVGPTADENRWAVDVMRKSAEVAQQHKVTLCIEYLNRFECYFLTTAAQAADLVKKVDHPSFRTMYDTFHANIEEKSPRAGVQAMKGLFSHVHISECDRGVPGTGMVRWDESFAALKEVGYDGWFVIEAFGRALPALAAATKVWRDLFAKPEDVYTDGLRFMKEKWAAAK